jgi:hypothetical protein
VLAALATKALRLGYLDGVELGTLVETLGHLAGEAEPALGRLVGPTGVASAGHLRRRLQRLASHPISCAKVRARHAALAVDADCECRFGGLPPGCYATPVLHALRAADVGAWKGLMRRRRRQAPKRKCQPCSPPTATADAGSREASPLRAIEDALRGVVAARRARPDTLDAALRRLLSAVDALPSGAVELSVGRLVVLRRDPPTFVITP